MLGKWVGVFKMEGCDHVRNYVFFWSIISKLLKGCVRYICACLYFKFEREHLSN